MKPEAKTIPVAPIPEFHLDWQGREIRVGSIVKHRYKPERWKIAEAEIMGTERALGFHNFEGQAPVIRLHSNTVEVSQHGRFLIPVFLPCFLEVVTP